MSNIDKRALREAAEKHGDDDILALLDELEAEQRISSTWRKTAESNREKLEAAEKRIAEFEMREVTLPCPACTYADHSHPAYSERQVVALLESLGIRINGEG